MSEPPITRAHHNGRSHGPNGTVTRVVVHDEEYPLGDSSAEHIAAYFANVSPIGCAHYVIDRDSEQHCVPDGERANHAPPNSGSIGIERDGYASWTAEKWNQPAAQRTTCNVAARTAELCVRYGLPAVWLSVADLQAGRDGITSHNNVSVAWGQSDHHDPGPAFPAAAFVKLVALARTRLDSDAVVRAFQQAAGLLVDGDPGVKTILALGRWLYETPATPVVPAPAPPVVRPPAPIPAKPTPAPTPELHVSLIDLRNADKTAVKGRGVIGMQRLLGVTADGIAGRVTKAALGKAQSRIRVTCDYVFGPATAEKLLGE